MASPTGKSKTFESGSGPSPTRARVFDCVRRGCNTVEDIAAALGLTDNAVRLHITALEQAGTIHRTGVVHRGTAGQPRAVYDLTESALERQSRAYAPVLAACIEELGEHLSPEAMRSVIRGVGHRLAEGVIATGEARSETQPATYDERLHHAVAVLEGLGATITATATNDGTLVEGRSCPLATAVARAPITCGAVQTLLAELTGTNVVEQCDHTERPRCRFFVPSE